MTKHVVFVIFCVCLILTCGGIASAQSYTSIPATFFGADTSACNPGYSVSPCYTSGIWEPWWPPASTPAVNIGSAGKVAQTTWDALDSGPAYLTAHTQTPAPGVYFEGTLNWPQLDPYVADAVAAGVPIHYTFMQQPQWAVCYNYGTIGSPLDYYGGPITANSNAIPCGSGYGVPDPYDFVYMKGASDCNGANVHCCPNGNSSGTGWCRGPGYNPTFNDITTFAQQLVDHYAALYPSIILPIQYFEVANEPDGQGAPYWQQDPNNIHRPDWEQLIPQTYWLEFSINAEYFLDGGDLSGPGAPIYVGPGITSYTDGVADSSLCGYTCNPSGSTGTGFLNTSVTIPSGPTVSGADLITIGSYHYYTAYDVGLGVESPACMNYSNGNTVYTTLECTGNNLVTAVKDRLADFYTYGLGNVSQVWMTEGSWNGNCNFSSCTSYSPNATVLQDMRAYIARYSIVTAATSNPSPSLNVTSMFWFSWEGNIDAPETSNGTACDGAYVTVDMITYPTALPCNTYITTPTTSYYAGYAYGQLIDWLGGGGGEIGVCDTSITNGCQDIISAVWSYPETMAPNVSSTPGLIAWVWDNPAISCSTTGTPSSGCPNLNVYNHYKDLEGDTYTITHSVSTPVTLTIEPFLFYN